MASVLRSEESAAAALEKDAEAKQAVDLAEKDEAGEDNEFAFDMTLKKKKKKKKAVAADGADAAAKEAGDEAENTATAESVAPVTGDAAAISFLTDGSGEVTDSVAGADAAAPTWLGSDRDYSYKELLSRVFANLRQNNPDLAGEKRKFTIVPPQILREGSKKTAFANISDLCRRMRRPIDHVTQYLLTELGTIGSSDGNLRLIIKGRFQQMQIENVLRRYIVEYVTCKTCRSPDTTLSKENRLFFQHCESCGSSRSVATIRSGFKAQTERRAASRQ